MQLFLIRHAQSQNNALPDEERVEDPPLTELGRRQAQRLAEALSALRLTHLVTSPFRRSLETTEYLRRAVRLTPHVRIELHELGGCVRGTPLTGMEGAPGMNREEILAHFEDYQLAPQIDGAGWWASRPQETVELAQARAAALLENTRREFAADARVAYVTHADFKRIFLEQFHLVDEAPWNTSLTSLTITSEEVRVDEFNNVAHLPPEWITA